MHQFLFLLLRWKCRQQDENHAAEKQYGKNHEIMLHESQYAGDDDTQSAAQHADALDDR